MPAHDDLQDVNGSRQTPPAGIWLTNKHSPSGHRAFVSCAYKSAISPLKVLQLMHRKSFHCNMLLGNLYKNYIIQFVCLFVRDLFAIHA